MNDIIKSISDEIEDVINKHMTNYILKNHSISAKVLKEIQEVIISGNIVNGQRNDFEIVEEIVCIFEKYGITAGGCHDY